MHLHTPPVSRLEWMSHIWNKQMLLKSLWKWYSELSGSHNLVCQLTWGVTGNFNNLLFLVRLVGKISNTLNMKINWIIDFEKYIHPSNLSPLYVLSIWRTRDEKQEPDCWKLLPWSIRIVCLKHGGNSSSMLEHFYPLLLTSASCTQA